MTEPSPLAGLNLRTSFNDLTNHLFNTQYNLLIFSDISLASGWEPSYALGSDLPRRGREQRTSRILR